MGTDLRKKINSIIFFLGEPKDGGLFLRTELRHPKTTGQWDLNGVLLKQ